MGIVDRLALGLLVADRAVILGVARLMAVSKFGIPPDEHDLGIGDTLVGRVKLEPSALVIWVSPVDWRSACWLLTAPDLWVSGQEWRSAR